MSTLDGTKALSVQCKSPKEVERWINYVQISTNYFKKTHAIKGVVIIMK